MISIVIPVYKVEQYLEDSVKSALNQDYRDIEVILVDDGSPDNCPALCDRLAESDSRIKVIHKPNKGVASARNAGIKAATGEYILFLDSDDCLTPDAAGFLLALIEKHGADLSMGTLNEMEAPLPAEEYREKAFDKSETSGFIFRNLGNIYGSSTCAKLFRKAKLPLFCEQQAIGEDILFNLEFIRNAGGVVFSNRRIYLYRRSVSGSLTKSYYKNRHKMYLSSYKKMRSVAEEMKAEPAQLSELRHHLIRMLLNCMTCVYNQSDMGTEEKKAEIKEICLDPEVQKQVQAWETHGVKDKLLKSFMLKANIGALYSLCAAEISRQKAERERWKKQRSANK